MIVAELNVLVYPINEDAADHQAVARWRQQAVDGDETIGIPWLVISGLLRITTRRGALAQSLAVDDALALVEEWLTLDQVSAILETDDHWPVFRRLLSGAAAGAKPVTDAHIAALTLCLRTRLATCH